MEKTLISDGPVKVTSHVDSEGNLIVEQWQDLEGALEFNKVAQNLTDGFSPERDLKATHEVPLVILEKMREKGIDWMNPHHSKAVLKELQQFGSAFRCSYDNHDPHIIVKGER